MTFTVQYERISDLSLNPEPTLGEETIECASWAEVGSWCDQFEQDANWMTRYQIRKIERTK
jgi:hypothetical protein